MNVERGRISAVCLAADDNGPGDGVLVGGGVCTGCTVAAARTKQVFGDDGCCSAASVVCVIV